MSPKLSVEDVLANLEARAALHRQQEAHHCDQEAYHEQQQAHHREQRSLHVAELEKVLKDLEAFRAVAESVAAQPVLRSAEIPPPGRNRVSRMVARTPRIGEPNDTCPWKTLQSLGSFLAPPYRIASRRLYDPPP
jgi:hypothetical protein